MKNTLIFPLLIFLTLVLSQCHSGAPQNSEENNSVSSAFKPDIDIALNATKAEYAILPGAKTKVYTYKSNYIKGKAQQEDAMETSYPGPIIRVKPGQKMRVRFKNLLPGESVIHWHGLHIPPDMDGHPKDAIDQGESYIYEFEINNRPGTYWFHPHPDKLTGPQVYKGLAGLFIVEGNKENLPSGKYDIPLIIQDRRFDKDNQLIYLDNNRMARMQGFLGDEIVVNGSQKRISNVKKASYRLRLLNGSNSRIYKLAWNDGSDIIAIATDGGLLEKPERMPYIMLAPGERVEIWKDFSSYSTWEEVQLKSLAFNPGSSMQMRGMMTDSETRTKNGDEFDIYSFKITSEQGPQLGLPASLSDLEVISQTEAVNNTSARKFNFSFERMEWVINGETFEMYEVADWEKVKLNSTEIWEFTNGTATGGMGMMGNMMQMPHPVHLHGLQFQILERDISQVDPGTWNSVKYGFLDKGWQDTFLLLPGMKVRIIMRFKDFTGMYIYHCHNLEHEDMGMMRNYEVIP